MNIRFLYPEFLYALFALAIPVIIHLFNFRRFRRVYFTNVRFLKEIKQETQSKSRLKHLLVLAARMLAITFLVFAFAQPYIPRQKSATKAKEKIIGVYIDNSFSMDAVGRNGILMEEARRKAREIAMAYKPSDRFFILTNDFEGRHQRLMSREEFLNLVDEVKPGPASRKITEVVARMKDMHQSELSTATLQCYLLSDFQQNMADIDLLPPDSTLHLSFIPLPAQQQNNIYIDTCYLTSPVTRPGEPLEMAVKIQNNGREPVENIPVKLSINGIQKALSSVTIQPGSFAEIRLPFSIPAPGWQKAEVSLTDYPVTFDDIYYLSFEAAQNIHIQALNGEKESPYLTGLFGKDPFFSFANTPARQVDYSTFPSFQLIVLNEVENISSGLTQELMRFMEKGGSVVMFPAPGADLESYNAFLASAGANTLASPDTALTRVSRLNNEDPLLKNIFEKGDRPLPSNLDLPVVKKHFPFSRISRSGEEMLLRLQNGNTFLGRYGIKKGNLYLFAVPLGEDYSNLARHAIFVPILYEIALHSHHRIPSVNVIGRDEVISYEGPSLPGDMAFHITREKNSFDIIPEHRNTGNKTGIFTHGQIRESGNYQLLAGSNLAAILSFNYDRIESDLTCLDEDAIRDQLSKTKNLKATVIDSAVRNFGGALKEMDEGIQLWKLCIIFVLSFLAVEMLLLRLWKS